MVPERIWRFFKRHKWKLIGTGIAVGGMAYVGRRIYIRLKELENMFDDNREVFASELLALIQGENVEGTNESVEDELTAKFPELKGYFERNQQVSDGIVEKALDRVREILFASYNIDDLSISLRDDANYLSAAEKEKAFNRIKNMCFIRCISALYLLHCLLWVHRIEVNLVARQSFPQLNSSPSKKTDLSLDRQNNKSELHAENFVFLTSTRYLQSAEGVWEIVGRVDAAVSSAISSIPPEEMISFERFEGILHEILQQIDSSLFQDDFASLVLPPKEKILTSPLHAEATHNGIRRVASESDSESEQTTPASGTVTSSPPHTPPPPGRRDRALLSPLSSHCDCVEECVVGLSASGKQVVGHMLAETRTALSSSRFHTAFTAVKEHTLRLFLEAIRSKLPTASQQNLQFPFAKCFGRLCTLAEEVLISSQNCARGPGGMNEYIDHFAQHPQVEGFCREVFYRRSVNYDSMPPSRPTGPLVSETT